MAAPEVDKGFLFFKMGILALQSLEERVHNLQENLLRRPVLRINGDKFRQYVKVQPRNYSLVLMFTALAGHRGCQICKYVNCASSNYDSLMVDYYLLLCIFIQRRLDVCTNSDVETGEKKLFFKTDDCR